MVAEVKSMRDSFGLPEISITQFYGLPLASSPSGKTRNLGNNGTACEFPQVVVLTVSYSWSG